MESGGKVNLAVGISLTLMSAICWEWPALLMDGPQHPDGDGVGGDEERTGPVTGQHLPRQPIAGGAGEIAAIEILLLHHPSRRP